MTDEPEESSISKYESRGKLSPAAKPLELLSAKLYVIILPFLPASLRVRLLTFTILVVSGLEKRRD